MFERYTDDARKVIFLARYEVSRLGSSSLQPEHLWLALLRESKKLMKSHAPQITLAHIESRLQPTPQSERISLTVDLPLSAETLRALTTATAEADRLGQRYISPEFLIRALLLEESRAAETCTAEPHTP